MTSFPAESAITARAGLQIVSRPTSFSVAGSSVRPMPTRALRPNDFVLKNGFPFLPDIWCRAQTLASATGEYLSDDRPDAYDVDIPAHTRFIAAEDLWDDVSSDWTPFVTQGVEYSFVGAPTTAPQLDDITYRIGKEVINRSVLSFTPGTFLTSSFNGGLDDALTFSISMAVILETPGDYGLIATDPSTSRFQITTDGVQLTANWSSGQITTAEPLPVTHYVPYYLCFSIGSTGATLYTGTGASQIRRVSLSAPSVSTQMEFIVGSDWPGNLNATFHLLEWGLWDYALSPTSDYSVTQLFSQYSSIYGAQRG